MSLPKDIRRYSKDWSELAERLTNGERVELPASSLAAARDARFRFYGFRDAVELHDKDNPWLAALLETRVTCPDNPPRIIFEKDLASGVLAGLKRLPKSDAQPRPIESIAQVKPTTHDDILLSLGYGRGDSLKKDDEQK